MALGHPPDPLQTPAKVSSHSSKKGVGNFRTFLQGDFKSCASYYMSMLKYHRPKRFKAQHSILYFKFPLGLAKYVCKRKYASMVHATWLFRPPTRFLPFSFSR
jgi:hypothetical protein